MIRVKTSDAKGRGLYLVQGRLRKNTLIAYMKKGKLISKASWDLKRPGGRDIRLPPRVRIWGRMYPADIGIHVHTGGVWYDMDMKKARLANPHSTSDNIQISEALLNTPRWYRLNHGRNPNVVMRMAMIKGRRTIGWFTNKSLLVRKNTPIELVFNYGDVPSDWG